MADETRRHRVTVSLTDHEDDVVHVSAYLLGVKRHELVRRVLEATIAKAEVDPQVKALVASREAARYAAGPGQRILHLATRDGVLVDTDEVAG